MITQTRALQLYRLGNTKYVQYAFSESHIFIHFLNCHTLCIIIIIYLVFFINSTAYYDRPITTVPWLAAIFPEIALVMLP